MDVTHDPSRLQLTGCPECGAVAQIVRRAVLESTDGPIEHAVVRCAAQHHFTLPTASLDHRTQPTRPAVTPVSPRP